MRGVASRTQEKGGCMRNLKLFLTGLVLAAASSISFAGGCLQGTFVYYDADGGYAGHRTVGCGADDGTWGTVTTDYSFTQGCSSPI